MFIFIDLCQNESTSEVLIRVGLHEGASRRLAAFPATIDGCKAAGRHIAKASPGAREFSCSSAIDFPEEYGLRLSSGDICDAIMLGMGCTISAF